MVMKENSLNLHFENHPANQQRVIAFLKQSFSEEEIYALGRWLGLETGDYVGKGMTKQQLCSSFVELITQRSLYDRLFVLLESPAYRRPRLYSDFSDFGIREPISEQTLKRFSQHVFTESLGNPNTSAFSEWLVNCKRTMVLVLGKDNTPEAWSRLNVICDYLSELGYTPILIKNQPDIGSLTNEEKMLAYAAVSRFILIEKSEPSGHIDEAHICATNRLVGVWLREEGKGDTWMQGDYEISYHHIKGFSYTHGQMENAIQKGVEWAEAYLKKKEKELNEIYPFRR